MIKLLGITIDDRTKPADLEKIRRNLVSAVAELQDASPRYRRDVELEDGVETPIPHGLGRRAFVLVSPPRGASTTGRIEEVRDSSVDAARYVVLRATGYGATVKVDLRFE